MKLRPIVAVLATVLLVSTGATAYAETPNSSAGSSDGALLNPRNLDFSPKVYSDESTVLTTMTPLVYGFAGDSNGGEYSLRFTVSTSKTSPLYVASCFTPQVLAGIPAACSIPPKKLQAGKVYWLSVQTFQGSSTSAVKSIGSFRTDQEVSAMEAAAALREAEDPAAVEAAMSAEDKALVAYYESNQTTIGASWTGTTSEGPAPSGSGNSSESITFAPDSSADSTTSRAAARSPIVCSLGVEWPHGSHHNPGRVNSISRSTCNSGMAAIWHYMALYKNGRLVASKRAPTFVTPTHWSQIDVGGCRVPDLYTSTTTASYYPPPGWLPPNLQRSASVQARINKCGR